MMTEFKPKNVKVPRVFHQLGILVLDGSDSMNEMGPHNSSKAKHVNGGIIELFNRLNVSRVKNNFSFACIKFDNTPSVTLEPTSFNFSTLMSADFDPTTGKGGGTEIHAALDEAKKMADTFLSSAPVDGVAHKVLVLLMSDGECFHPEKTKAVASGIKSNNKIQIAAAYFGKVGENSSAAQNLLKEVSSDPISFYTTVYDGEALRAFFERSISQSTNQSVFSTNTNNI